MYNNSNNIIYTSLFRISSQGLSGAFKAQPELAILAINTFRKDATDPNPLIRSLAVRTMGCIRLDQVTEHFGKRLQTFSIHFRAVSKDFYRFFQAVLMVFLTDLEGSRLQKRAGKPRYLLEPLRRCCQDHDPYVRKTSAICIPKARAIHPLFSLFMCFPHLSCIW